jgi:hypothetical protein
VGVRGRALGRSGWREHERGQRGEAMIGHAGTVSGLAAGVRTSYGPPCETSSRGIPTMGSESGVFICDLHAAGGYRLCFVTATRRSRSATETA